jgi:predicted O-methyltransferase YrrM
MIGSLAKPGNDRAVVDVLGAMPYGVLPLPMHDTLLHPVSAMPAYGNYRALRSELEALVRQEFPGTSADRAVQEALSGKLNFPDAFILRRLLLEFRPRKVLEVGSFVGFSTRWMLDIVAQWNGTVTSVDPNIRHRVFDSPGDVLQRLNARHLPARLEVVHGFFGTPGDVYHDYEHHEPRRSREFVDQLVASRERVTETWPRKFDFIFIDGDHTYEAVMENFRIALQLLEPGGCLAFHDALSWQGVYDALQEIGSTYSSKAETRIFGQMDHRVFQGWLGKHTGGIGFFKLHENAAA